MGRKAANLTVIAVGFYLVYTSAGIAFWIGHAMLFAGGFTIRDAWQS